MLSRLLLLTLASVLTISAVGWRILVRQIEATATERLSESARSIRDSLQAYLRLHESAIAIVAASIPPSQGNSEDSALAQHVLENTGAVYGGFLTLLITDSEGRVLSAFRRDSNDGKSNVPRNAIANHSVADRPYFYEPKSTGKPYVSGVFEGRGLGHEPIVAVSAPLWDSQRHFSGVVEGSIDIRKLPIEPLVEHQLAYKSLLVVAQDASERIVFSTKPQSHPPLLIWSPVPAIDNEAKGKLLEVSDLLQVDDHKRPVPQIAFAVPVQMAGWKVVASMSTQDRDRELNEFNWNAGFALLLLCAFTWQTAEWMTRSISQPIELLAKNMEGYELDLPPSTASGRAYVAKEIARIEEEFLKLGSRLRDSFHRLNGALIERDEKNQQLEELLRDLDLKVQERTREFADSEARYRQVVEHSDDIIYRTDLTGRITLHNAAFERLLGSSAAGRRVQEFMEVAGQRPLLKKILQQLRKKQPSIYLEFPVRGSGDERYWIGQSTQLLMDEEGQAIGFQAIAWDITEKKAAENALREAEERFSLAVRGSKSGIWDWDLRSGKVYYSAHWKQMFGLAQDQTCVSIRDWLSRVHPADYERVKADLDEFITSGSSELLETGHRMRHLDGTWRWVLTSGAAVRGKNRVALRIAGSTSDITSGKLVDALSGLPNRLAMVERLEQLISRQKEEPNRSFALLFLDLDRFKLINDSLGHVSGDYLLLEVARRIEAAVAKVFGATGCVGRLGGDEFVVLLENAAESGFALQVAKGIQKEMESPFQLDGSVIFATVSIGIAYSGSGVKSAEDMIRNSDSAMYQAKQEGRGRHRLFDSSMHERALARLELETDLRRALEANEFLLHYQPQVCLRSGRLSGFEALVRWRHPKRGLVAPADFIPIAEENGLILPLGRWVLENGCRQLAAWDKDHGSCRALSMSVNLSALQFSDPSLLPLVASVLRETGLSPSRLRLEVTESMVANDPEGAQSILNSLSELGVGLEIDDFGTGYSCLSQLHQLPFDTLKVDRSFVLAMDQEHSRGQDGRKVVESIITLSANLGISVIAEGIETEANWSQLAMLGCDYGQGYFFSRPIPALEALRVAQLRAKDPWPLPLGLERLENNLMQLERSLHGGKHGPNFGSNPSQEGGRLSEDANQAFHITLSKPDAGLRR